MARGSKRKGSNLKYFDAKLVLPKKSEPINEATACFQMKTRVEVNDEGQVIRDSSLPPVARWSAESKKVVTSVSAVPSLRSKTWDYVANEDYLSGALVKVETGSYTYEGDEIPTFKILLKDAKEKELYALDFRFNGPVFSFLNSFTNLRFEDDEKNPVLHNLGISVASRKDNKGVERVTLYLRSDSIYNNSDDLVSWRFTKNPDTGFWEDSDGVQLPKVEEVKVGNKTIYDTTALTSFYVSELERIAKILENLKINDEGEVVSGNSSTDTNTSMTNQNSYNDDDVDVEEDDDDTDSTPYSDDDLPF